MSSIPATLRRACVAAAIAAATWPAAAASFSLNLTANGNSRWYDYFSDAFAEITQPFNGSQVNDGFFAISALPAYQQIGGGFDTFPFETAFSAFGSVTYANGSGTGAETLAVSAISLNPNTYIDAELVVGTPTVILGSVSGTVSTFDGAVTGLNLSVPVTFRYDGAGFGVAFPLDFSGTFTIAGGAFALTADGSYNVGFPDPARVRWDVAGAVNNLSPIPEPDRLALLLAGLAVTAGVARRRLRD